MTDPALLTALLQREAVANPINPAIEPAIARVATPPAATTSNSSSTLISARPEGTSLTEFSSSVRPRSGSQLYYQRLAALRAGRLYTRLPANSFVNVWRQATRQPTYEDWKQLLRQEARSVAAGQGDNRLSIIVGDSISQWFPSDRLPSNQLWLNQGISGDTTAGILQRLSAFAGTRPQAIYLMAGINDLKHGATDNEVLWNLYQIIHRLRQNHPQARVVVQSILPTDDARFSNAQINRINQRLELIAQREGAFYLDLHSQFIDDGGKMRADLTTDGLHLNPQGYQTWQAVLQYADAWMSWNLAQR